MMQKGIKVRVFKEHNYKAIFFNGSTIRIALDENKPISELAYSEFYDVDIFETSNGICFANCPYCYLSGNTEGNYVVDAVSKIKKYFGEMSANQKPFQVALPGSGEFFEHPNWAEILETFDSLDIVPNYTTNGMWAIQYPEKTDLIIQKTKDYCGGVAVSCHPHLEKYWTTASQIYFENDIMLNMHIIISDNLSIDFFRKIYDEWVDKVAYFVLLPYGEQGRASKKQIDWEYLISKLPVDQSKLAFGANFYAYLKKSSIKVSLYEPESMSSFLGLYGKGTLYKSSFSLNNIISKDFF